MLTVAVDHYARRPPKWGSKINYNNVIQLAAYLLALVALTSALKVSGEQTQANEGRHGAAGLTTEEVMSIELGDSQASPSGLNSLDGSDPPPVAQMPHLNDVGAGAGDDDILEYDFMQKYKQLKEHLTSGLHHENRAKQDASEADADEHDAKLSPIILIPGYGGSRLEGKRNKRNVKHYFCERISDWSNIWIDLKLMLPYMIDCLIEDFRLEFDPKTNTTHNTQGIDIRVRDPDDVANVEFLTDIHLTSFGYFATIIRKLTVSLGYKRNHNIRGAPYDFRKAPNELGEFFAKLKRDSESLHKQFQGKRLTYICHSMGCNNILYFLQQQSQQWKDQHVLRVISLAAPWAGSMQAVRATVFGDNLGLPYLFDEAELRIVQKSVPSTMYLYPKARAFQDSPLISFKDDKRQTSEALTAAHFKRFFDKIDHPSGYLMWLNTKDLLGSLEAPQVEVWCLYGKGRATLGRMEFAGDFPNSPEEDIHDDGDGTVTIQSSAFCQQWAGEQKQPIHARPFPVGHVDILRDTEVLDALVDILGRNDD